MKSKLFIMSCLLSFYSINLFGQSVQVNIFLQPLPSPYFTEWEADDGILEIQFLGNFPQPANIMIELSVDEDNHGRVFTAQSEIIQVQPGQWEMILNNSEMLQWPVIEFGAYIDQTVQGGRYPDGNYTLCARVFNVDNQNLEGESCSFFTILLPDPPQIITPAGNQTCQADNLIIQWTPVQWIPGEPVFYIVVVTEVLPTQVPEEAMNTNPEHFSTQVESQTILIYPADALELESGHQYAIQVQSVDDQDQPLGSNSGYSQVESCTVADDNQGSVFQYEWQEDVEYYTSDEFTDNLKLSTKDPCEEIRELINKLQDRLKLLLFNLGDANDRITKADKQINKAKKDGDKADTDLADAKKELEQAEKDRKTILNSIVKNSGGKWGTWNNGKPSCNSQVVIGPSNGNLQLGGNNAICMGGGSVDKFLDNYRKWEDDLKALNEKISKAEENKADAEKRKEDAKNRKEKAEADKKKAEKDKKQAEDEIKALKEALGKLKEAADECDIVIDDLQKKYDEAKAKIDEAVENLEDAKKKGGGGKNSKDKFGEADDKIDEANEHLKNGEYEDAKSSADEANELTGQGGAWSESEDCLEKAKQALKDAKEKLKEKKKEFPGGDFTDAENAIKEAEDNLDKAEEAYDNGDMETVDALCPKIKGSADAGGSYAESITCNEGDTKESKNVLVEEEFMGKLIMPYGVDPDNLGYKMKEFFASIGDPLDIEFYVNTLYSLTSVSYMKSIYDVYYVKRCTQVLICKSGKWVHHEYKDCTEGLENRMKVEMAFDQVDLKEELKSNLSNIYKELKKYLKK